jgi:hypothetical protein
MQTQTYINVAAFVLPAKQSSIATKLGIILARLRFPPGAEACHAIFRK